jgi:hypothetical protein
MFIKKTYARHELGFVLSENSLCVGYELVMTRVRTQLVKHASSTPTTSSSCDSETFCKYLFRIRKGYDKEKVVHV